jgi:uncharacterized caspase-like protein
MVARAMIRLLMMLAAGLAPVAAAAQEAGPARVRALLIGATDYPDDHARFGLTDLVGAGNDVKLMADTLVARGAKVTDIVVLTDVAMAGPVRAAGRPTLAAVRQGFADLAAAARPGEQIVVQISGHGMQQPEARPGNEPDGLDEVFLPLDARFREGPGATRMGLPLLDDVLTDDEIGAALAAIRAKGADVLFIADFCHSGDSTRGTTGGRGGDVKLRADGEAKVAGAGAIGRKGAYVGFFASPSPVTASETLAPWWLGEAAQAHGVLSAYTAVALRDESLGTWLDVARRVESYVVQHNAQGRLPADMAPPPQFEGDLEGRVLGRALGPKGRVWALTKPPAVDDPPPPITALTLNAGGLDGLREGALLSLSLTDARGRERIVMHGRATQVRPTRLTLAPAEGPRTPLTAWTKPRDADGAPLTGEARYLVRLVRNGADLRYRVHVRPPTDKTRASLARVMRGVRLDDLGASKAANEAEAELDVRVEGDKLAFLSSAAPDGRGFGAVALADLPGEPQALGLRLRAAIEAAARFHRLRALLMDMGETGGEGDGETAFVRPRMEFFVWRPRSRPASASAPCEAPPDFASGEPIPADATPFSALGASAADVVRLARCDVVLARVTNVDSAPVDLTALVLKPDGAIEPLETQDARRVRLEPGRSGTTGYILEAPAALDDLRDDLVMIAVRAPVGEGGPEGVPADFNFLCQPPVTDAGSLAAVAFVEATGCGVQRRRRAAGAVGAAETALGQLFEAAATGDRRGAEAAPRVGRTAILRVSWVQAAAPTSGEGGR